MEHKNATQEEMKMRKIDPTTLPSSLSPAMLEAKEGIKALVDAGEIQCESDADGYTRYTGIASDGVRVTLGEDCDLLGMWAYLLTHPNRDQW